MSMQYHDSPFHVTHSKPVADEMAAKVDKEIRTTPKLTRVTIDIGYTCDDGYRQKLECRTKQSVESPLIAAIYELARIAHLYGYGCQADAAYNEAKGKVESFLSENGN